MFLKKVFDLPVADNGYFFGGLPDGKNLIINTNKTKAKNNTTYTKGLPVMLL
jgi:hypothetical protein